MSNDRKTCGCDLDTTCVFCCEHQDVCEDEFVCLVCGDDRREHYMSMAYDRVKDRAKYGDS